MYLRNINICKIYNKFTVEQNGKGIVFEKNNNNP